MLEKWHSLRDTFDETTSIVRWFLGAIVVLSGLTVALGKWLSQLNAWQAVAFYVLIGALVLIAFTFAWDWQRKRSIESIPDLLARIDQLTLEYIDDFTPKSISLDIIRGLAKLIGAEAHVDGLIMAVEKGNKQKVEQELEEISKQYDRFVSPKKRTEDTLQNLLFISGFLNANNVGLECVTDHEKYHQLYTRVRYLQKMLPSAETNIKINEYWRWSEGLYSILLSIKPIVHMPKFDEMVPPKFTAGRQLMRPTIEGLTAIYISAVRESIQKYKERNIEKTSKDKKKS